jgi:hypothetical protein
MIATPRAKYLAEMAQLSEHFAELAEAFKPSAGETDTMIVPVSVMRRLMDFVGRALAELQEIAGYVPDEVLEGMSQTAITASAAPYDLTFNLLESHAAAEHRFRNSSDDEAVDELRQLTWDIARNVPTTTLGAIATLKYLGRSSPKSASQDYCDWLATLHRSLAAALERVTDSAYPRYLD